MDRFKSLLLKPWFVFFFTFFLIGGTLVFLSLNLFEGEMSLTVAFPFHVTKEIVDKLIKREGEDERLAIWRNLYN